MDKLQEEQEKFYKLISPKLVKYVRDNLSQSLTSINFSKEFVVYLLKHLANLDFPNFYKKFDYELERIYTKGFFQNIVPSYFDKNVIPNIPASNYIIDIGCGTGILAHRLIRQSRFKKIEGIDISTYPEWKLFSSEKVKFKIVPQQDFDKYLSSTPFDNVVLTWSLHHMPYDEQESYLKKLFSHLKTGGTVVILEDSYSEKLKPEFGEDIWKEFMKLSADERRKVMSFYDWIANRVLAKRYAEPIPCTYRTLEEWSKIGEKIGFKTFKTIFIGFPDNRDINTPQSLIVFRK
jgi:SAM-dependent methyltransferase